MSDLLDANVWVALTNPDHIHHPRAQQYWDAEVSTRMLFCRLTSLALLRILTNRAVMKDRLHTGPEAWLALEQWLDDPMIEMVNEPYALTDSLAMLATRFEFRAGDWTDAYLAAFASAGGYRLVTFDAGFKRFPALDVLVLDPDNSSATTSSAEH